MDKQQAWTHRVDVQTDVFLAAYSVRYRSGRAIVNAQMGTEVEDEGRRAWKGERKGGKNGSVESAHKIVVNDDWIGGE